MALNPGSVSIERFLLQICASAGASIFGMQWILFYENHKNLKCISACLSTVATDALELKQQVIILSTVLTEYSLY